VTVSVFEKHTSIPTHVSYSIPDVRRASFWSRWLVWYQRFRQGIFFIYLIVLYREYTSYSHTDCQVLYWERLGLGDVVEVLLCLVTGYDRMTMSGEKVCW